MHVFSTYIITNAYKGTLYIGHTDNLAQRMDQHRQGLIKGFSKTHKLKHLVWHEDFETRDEAFKRERRMKEWNRAWKINLIAEMNPEWFDLSTVPVWPLPDETMFPDLYISCLEHRLMPNMRRNDRSH